MPPGRAIHEIRRRDRSQDDAWIRSFLRSAPFGFLASVEGTQPFLNSNLFVYSEEDHAIYLHTHRTGRTRDNLARPSKVAFSVAEMGRLLPAAVALEFSVEYASVVVFGTGEIVENSAEAERGLQRLLDKYAPHLRPGRDYRAIVPEELARTAVFRIRVESWSGKRKRVDDHFPAAYRFEDVVDRSGA